MTTIADQLIEQALDEDRYVKRDPYARTTLMKAAEAGECDFCGSSLGGRHAGKVWRFTTQHDGGGLSREKNKFCSQSCRTAYHG